MYHSTTYGQLTAAEFVRQMDTLAELGFRTMTLAELPAYLSGRQGGGRVILTFDDIGNTTGTDLLTATHDDFWSNVYPTLHRLHFAGVLAVVTDKIHEEEGNGWAWPELLRLQAEGYQIVSHSATHDVRMNRGRLSEDEFRRELCASRQAILLRTGVCPDAYVWPFGAVLGVDRAGYDYQAIAEACGYSMLVTVWESGAVSTPKQLLRVPRYHPERHIRDFESLMRAAELATAIRHRCHWHCAGDGPRLKGRGGPAPLR